MKREICIIGAGPAGLYAALSLAKKGIPSTIVDKAFFPRDKVCGEALTSSVLRCIQNLDPDILESQAFKSAKHSIDYLRFFAPNHHSVRIPFDSKINQRVGLESFISIRRIDLDNVLMDYAKANPLIEVIEGFAVNEVKWLDSGVQVFSDKREQSLEAQMLLIANGYNSKFVKQAGLWGQADESNACGLTAYYENVSGISDGKTAECYLLDDLKSGGLYVLPVAKGLVNVNIAMRNDVRKKYQINLRKVLEANLKSHPALKERFKDAIVVQKPKGHGYHLGVKRRKIIGDRFMLIGDAGGFNDAISANGIAHAMISAEHAAEALKEAYAQKDFSEASFRAYQKKVYRSFFGIRWQGILSQPFFIQPKLLFFFVNKLFKYRGAEDLISLAMYKKNPWSLVFDATFYKLLFGLKKEAIPETGKLLNS